MGLVTTEEQYVAPPKEVSLQPSPISQFPLVPDDETPPEEAELLTGDPTSPVDGDSWYNSTLGKFRCKEAGVIKNMVGLTSTPAAYAVVAHVTTSPPDPNNPVVTPPLGLLVVDLDIPDVTTTPVPEAPTDGKTYGRINGSWAQCLPIVGGTLTGNLTISPASGGSTFMLNAVAGQFRTIQAQTAGSPRWNLNLANGAAESGSNAGSDFQIGRCNDAGTVIDYPFQITRASGAATFGGNVTFLQTIAVQGGTAQINSTGNPLLVLNKGVGTFANQIYCMMNNTVRWIIQPGDGATETGTGNAGSNFAILRYTDAGAYIDSPFSMIRATGQATFTAPALFPSNATNANTNPNGWDGIRIDGAAGSGLAITGQRANSIRWRLVLGNSTAESGSNAGSDCFFNAYNDAGVLIGSPLTITRSTGLVSINAIGVTANQTGGLVGYCISGLNKAGSGTANIISATSNNSARWQIRMGDETAESGSDVGSDFLIRSFTDAGVAKYTPLTIFRGTGQFRLNCPAGNVIATLPHIDGPAGQVKAIYSSTNGVERWGIQLATSPAETGSNAGSDFGIFRFADNGTFIDQPFGMNRATGAAYFYDGLLQLGATNPNAYARLTIDGAATHPKQIAIQTAGSVRWIWNLSDGSAETGSNAGSNMAWQANSDSGAALGTVFSVVRSTQVVTFTKAIVNGPSDRSLKTDIQPIGDCLEKVKKLQGVSFRMIDDPEEHTQIGLIAQDVEPIIPEVIQQFNSPDFKDKGIKLAIDYPKLTAVLIEAVKELSSKLSALEARL